MNHRSLERAAYLRSAVDASAFNLDPLAFTGEEGSSNQSRPSSTEAANKQIIHIEGAEKAVDLKETTTFTQRGVIVEQPYETSALEMGARWFDTVDPLVM